MASISRIGDRYRIQFSYGGRRHTLRLGACSYKTASEIKDYVDSLSIATANNVPPDPRTQRWVQGLADNLRRTLATAGLIEPTYARTVSDLLEIVRGRGQIKESTRASYRYSEEYLLDYFGEKRLLSSITRGDVDGYVDWLRGTRGLQRTSVAKHVARGRAIFSAAVRHKWIAENPFRGVRGGSFINNARREFISAEQVREVIAACDNLDIRAILTFSRWGGLRVPSETSQLRWDGVDWQQRTLVVRSPKTERHAGHEQRLLPMFPELVPIIEELWDATPEGQATLLSPWGCRVSSGTLRSRLLTIFKRAGVKPWPRLLHNLRASRETELVERFPIQVVCGWIGNTPSVAMGHYLQITRDHYARAVQGDVKSDVISSAPDEKHGESDAESDAAISTKSSLARPR